MFLFELIAFVITLTIPGYLLIGKYFDGLEKAVLSVFLSLSITSFLFYIVVSFFGISKEFIFGYSLLLLILFIVLEKPKPNDLVKKLESIKIESSELRGENLVKLMSLFILVLVLVLTAFFIPTIRMVNYDDSAYHLPVIYDVAVDGQKTFFSETHNIYQVRSNQFPLLFEFFVGSTKLFLGNFFYWFVSFFSLILCLFLIYFISKEAGYNEFFSPVLYALSPIVLVFTRYFGVENFVSLFFLGCVFFVLRFVKTENVFFVVVAGFLAGLMFLTKFTGGIFFVGLLLFLLYKRKFKGSSFFVLVFVLVSLVFVFSHFGVPFDQTSVGDYGRLSDNILIQIPLNFLGVLDKFWLYFSNNYYIFFVPFLFFLGLFWRNNKKSDFSVLFFISLTVFLFVTLFNQAEPTHSGFPRYFLPIYSLLCIFSGIQLDKIFSKGKKITAFFGTFFVLIILITSLNVLEHFTLEKQFAKGQYFVGKKIENTSETTVWFINGASLRLKLDKAVLYDYVWRADFSGAPCDFLKKNEIDYIIYFHIDKDPSDLGEFGTNLRKSLMEGECSEMIAKSEGSLNTATFKIN